MRIKRMLVMIGLVSFAGASSYAMAQSYVFRSPVIGVKVDSSSALQEDIKRKEDIDMCSSEKVYIETELEEVKRINLNEPTYTNINRLGDAPRADHYITLRDGKPYPHPSTYFGPDRLPSFMYSQPDGPGALGIVPIHGSATYEIYETGDVFEYQGDFYLVGDKILEHTNAFRASYYGSSAEHVNELVVSNKVEVETATENYDWCVKNGYETAN